MIRVGGESEERAGVSDWVSLALAARERPVDRALLNSNGNTANAKTRRERLTVV